ncbi:Anaerobic ribonucleoside-triphosphate reductase activating protein [Candidatus Magnetomorum sp. HK-1]|nr:Anaerobic ribonucleoside-triphosphate reductase activating protein [Candidatus Magnetomorum sp. HK-1]
MRFGGFIKNSLIDYPGKISAVIFFKGCNYRCPYCHNKDLVFGPGPIAPVSTPNPNTNVVDESFVLSFLEKRKKFIDGVVLSGGEPTLAKSLVRICQTIKSLGFLLKIDTNGSYPDVLENLMYHNLIDYIAMDIKTSPNRYPRYISKKFDLDAFKKSIQLIKDSNVDYEFRTTCAWPIVDKSAIHNMVPHIEGARRFVLQPFVYSSDILDPEFFKDQKEFEKEDMQAYQELILPWVKKCIIRS